MPISQYDKHFGGDAAAAHGSMIRTYGPKKGKRVFYATMNKKKKESERAAAQRRFFTGHERRTY